jgi:hypothetical protein
MTEKFQRSIHEGLSHYMERAETNCDLDVFMAYRSIPHTSWYEYESTKTGQYETKIIGILKQITLTIWKI